MSADLVVNLAAYTSQFAQDLSNAQGNLRTFADRVEATARETMKRQEAMTNGSGFGAMVRNLAGPIAAYASLHTVVSAVSRQIEEVDRLGNVSGRLGIPIHDLSTLGHAANMVDVEFAKLEAALPKMMKNIAVAAEQSKDILGLSAKGLLSQSPAEQFAEIAQRIKEMENPTLRVQAAMEVFGKGGAELLQVIDLGKDGIAAWAKDAEKLGIAIDEVDAAAIGEADDNIKRMKLSVDGLSRSFAIGLAPAISDATNSLAEFLANGPRGEGGMSDLSALVEAAKLSIQAAFTSGDEAERLLQESSNVWAFGSKDAGAARAAAQQQAAEARERERATQQAIADQQKLADVAVAARELEADGWMDVFDSIVAVREEGEKLSESLVSPIERANQQWERAQELYRESAISLGDLSKAQQKFNEETAKHTADPLKDVKQFAIDLKHDIATPMELFEEQIQKINEAKRAGLIDQATFDRAVQDAQNKAINASGLSGVNLDEPQRDVDAGRARALDFGSAESFSAIIRSMNPDTEKANKTTATNTGRLVQLQTDMSVAINKLANQNPTVVSIPP